MYIYDQLSSNPQNRDEQEPLILRPSQAPRVYPAPHSSLAELHQGPGSVTYGNNGVRVNFDLKLENDNERSATKFTLTPLSARTRRAVRLGMDCSPELCAVINIRA